jgi:hypothetical protein
MYVLGLFLLVCSSHGLMAEQLLDSLLNLIPVTNREGSYYVVAVLATLHYIWFSE